MYIFISSQHLILIFICQFEHVLRHKQIECCCDHVDWNVLCSTKNNIHTHITTNKNKSIFIRNNVYASHSVRSCEFKLRLPTKNVCSGFYWSNRLFALILHVIRSIFSSVCILFDANFLYSSFWSLVKTIMMHVHDAKRQAKMFRSKEIWIQKISWLNQKIVWNTSERE